MNSLPRRRFLVASFASFASVASFASAGVKTTGATGVLRTHAAGDGKVMLPRTLVLYRENQTASHAFAMLGGQAGLPVEALTADPVRQWRDGLGALVTAGWRLAGISNWIDFTIVRGLAAEVRRLPLLVLEPGVAQLQLNGIDATAAALLDFALESNAEEIVRKHALLTSHSLHINNRPGLFAWVI